MKKAALRGFFVIALLLSVVIQQRTIHARNHLTSKYDIAVSLKQALKQHQVVFHKNPHRPPLTLSTILYFQRPGCADKSFAMPFALNIDALERLQRVQPAGYVHRFHYFDQTWTSQASVSMFVLWAKYNLLTIASASPFVPIKQAVVVADPAPCADKDPVDWKQIWRLPSAPKTADDVAKGGHVPVQTAGRKS